ncbi:c-type cytochrome [Terricaulis sp.]|uniref:c-type cytochrome n=1 Tax=Terricaulis sp. TaxID=2768686 RepID=UPI0037844626
MGTPVQTPGATSPPDMAAEASPARGLVYAQSVCASCHAVETGQTSSPNPQAPPFEVIANLPGMTPAALNVWLHSPHPSMPNMIVAPDDRDDVAAYLNSLKHGAGRG